MEVPEVIVGHEVAEDPKAVVDNFLRSGLKQNEKSLMDLGLYNNSTKLLNSGEVGHYPQTLAAYLFMINLDNKVHQNVINQLSFNQPVLLIAHQNLLVIEEHIAETTQNSGD